LTPAGAFKGIRQPGGPGDQFRLTGPLCPTCLLSPTPRMNKAELVEAVKKEMGGITSKAAAERAIDAVLAAVKRGLRSDKEVQLVGFGTFVLAGRSARRGFNPHTRKPMRIPAMKTIRFRAGADLRELT